MLVRQRDARGAPVSDRARFGAAAPSSPGDSIESPGDSIDEPVHVVVVNGHSILMRAVHAADGPRYRVRCETCGAAVSEATSSPQREIARHAALSRSEIRDAQGWGN